MISRSDRAIRRMSDNLAAESRRLQTHPLLLLPSTPAAFSLVARYIGKGLPLEVIGNAASMQRWAPGIAERTRSPLTLWRSVKDAATLPFAIASFQDQLVQVDDSYHCVDVDGQTYHVSPIEAMLAMRFQPRTLLGTAVAGRSPRKPSSLALAPFAMALPATASRTAFDAVLARLIESLIACQASPVSDWHARQLFNLKAGRNYDRMLAQRLQEIDALIRVHHDRHGSQAALAELMTTLRGNRQALLADIA